MRTALTATAAVLVVLAAGCGGSDPAPTRAQEEAAPAAAASPAALSGGLTPTHGVTGNDLLQCLGQSGLPAWGWDARTTGTPADYVDAQRLEFTAGDASVTDPNSGGLWVFADAETAAGYAEYAFEAEKLDDVDPATAAYELHGNVLVISERPLASPADPFEQRLLDCLPDAAAPTAVLPPAPGTVTTASLMTCLQAGGLRAQGDVNNGYDLSRGVVGTVDVRTEERDGVAYVRLYADAVEAADREAAEMASAEPGSWVRRGNTIASFHDEQVDAADAATAVVLGCLTL